MTDKQKKDFLLVIVYLDVYSRAHDKTKEDIKGFRALIMAGGYKSLRLVLQRVGRILRKKETDNTALVYDMIDSFNKILWQHSQQRLKIYQNEGFDIKYLN